MDSVPIIETWYLSEYLRELKFLEEVSVVVDIGAHIGTFSIFAATRFKEAKVYAFEPEPSNFKLLKENIQINKLEERITPFNLAVGGGTGKQIELHYHPTSLASSSTVYSMRTEETASAVKVNSISLKDIFQENKLSHCDLLKMDCEGAEYEILFSTPQRVLNKIKSISLEAHGGGDIPELKSHLEARGFHVKLARIFGFLGMPLLAAQRQTG